MAAAAPNNYMLGYEYDLGNGTTGVWGGKSFMTPDAYLAQKKQAAGTLQDDMANLNRLNQAAPMVDKWDATGFLGGLESGEGSPSWSPFHGIGGTAGYNLNAKLAPVRSSATLKNLSDVQQSSPTGASPFAKVTNYEAQVLQGRHANLDTRQSPDQLKSEIQASKDALIRHTPGLDPSNPIDLATTDPATIPEGAFWRHPDGTVYRQQKAAGGGQPANPRATANAALKAQSAAASQQQSIPLVPSQ